MGEHNVFMVSAFGASEDFLLLFNQALNVYIDLQKGHRRFCGPYCSVMLCSGEM